MISHSSLTFDDIAVAQTCFQKNLGTKLDGKLTFEEHLYNLQNVLTRSALLTTYKSFVSLHLDYEDILYDQTFN